MEKDLTNSKVIRQNILNNQYAISEIQKSIGLEGIEFDGKFVFLKEQLAEFFEISDRTIDNYLSQFEGELKQNGYVVLRGKHLKELKSLLIVKHVDEIGFVDKIKKSPTLGIFDFRAFLNISMLIIESEKARYIRQVILDIAIDAINKRTGGSTKYINQRDEDFVESFFVEGNYRKEFTQALESCVEMGNIKYSIYTNKIYVSIFKENAQEYRRILRLLDKDKTRDTMYAEILDLISSYEYGFAQTIKSESAGMGRRLKPREVDELFKKFEDQPHWKPLIERARNKMASRDLAFRDALHLELTKYITPLDAKEFERFIGEKSRELEERLEEAKDVMKRLKDRD